MTEPPIIQPANNPSEAASPPPRRGRRAWLWYLAIALGVTALVWALGRKTAIDWRSWWTLVTDQDELRALIDNAGMYAPLVCIGMNFLQVVIFFIPGEVTQIVAGLAFGTVWGFIYSATGIILGSLFNFHIARWLGHPFVERIIEKSTIQKVDRFMSQRKGLTAIALMFLMPGFPKDALCYIVGGVTSLSYTTFFIVSSLGRLPALFFSVMFGANVGEGDLTALVILALAFAAFLLVGWWWKKRSAAPES